MKFANIVPIAQLEKYGKLTDYHLVLTHLVQQSEEYAEFMKRRSEAGDFLLMDNSLIELGSAMKIVDVIEAARKCEAHEIVLPDVFREREATIKTIQLALEDIKHYYGYNARHYGHRLMAVPQGKNEEDWLECLFTILRQFPQVTTIGIPKVTSTFYPDTDTGRICLLEFMDKHKIHRQYPHMQWHLLGIWNNPIELKRASKFSWVRGCDSSVGWAISQQGIVLDDEEGALRPKTAIIDFFSQGDKLPSITSHNLITMLGWAKYHE